MKAFHNDKGNVSVELTINRLIELGFSVLTKKKLNANGPDIQAIKNNVCYNIEVKTVSKTTRSWRVGSITNVGNDFIAMVFPNGIVHIEEMSSHLLKCSVDKSRRVTNLAKLYE